MPESLRVRAGVVEVSWAQRSRLGPDGDAVVLLAGDSPEAASAVLAALRSAGRPGVVASVRPITDTLKQVDHDGGLLGTADRDRHRLVGSPIAAPLAALLAVPLPDPTAVELLACLAATGLPVTPHPQ